MAHKRGTQYWLMKSEPDVLSIQDLKRHGVFRWDGVRNFEARNFMRDRMQVGDLAIFYHSSAKIIGPAGICRIASAAYPDFTAWDAKSPYFDPRSPKNDPLWWMVDVAHIETFSRVLPRESMKHDPILQDMLLWKRSRLSIIPLTAREFHRITTLVAQ